MYIIYYAWLIVRDVESNLWKIDEPDSKDPTIVDTLVNVNDKRRVILFFRKIEHENLLKAVYYAKAQKFLVDDSPDGKIRNKRLMVTGDGFAFSTRLGLIDKIVKTFSWLLQMTSILIALAALWISLMASNK